MPVALRFTVPSPKTEVFGREKTSMTERLPADFVVCLAPVWILAQRLRTVSATFECAVLFCEHFDALALAVPAQAAIDLIVVNMAQLLHVHQRVDALFVQALHQLTNLLFGLPGNSRPVDGLHLIVRPPYRALTNGDGFCEQSRRDSAVNAGVAAVSGFSLDGWHSEY